jgi:hypothetical protein
MSADPQRRRGRRAILGRQLRPEDILDLEDEALAETGNVILNSWLATIANLLKLALKMSLPAVIRAISTTSLTVPALLNHASCFFISSSRSAIIKCKAMLLS